MKTLLTCLLFFFFHSLISGQSYYWVGDGGNWSDLSHWATSSGGSEMHTSLPTKENDVFFDENSFSSDQQDIVIDSAVFECRNLIIKDVNNEPTFQSEAFNNQLNIYGDLEISSPLLWGITYSYLKGETTSTILIDSAYMGGFLVLSPENSAAMFELKGDLETLQLNIVNGIFDSKDYSIVAHEFRVGMIGSAGQPRVNLNQSNVESSRFIVFDSTYIVPSEFTLTVFQSSGNATNLFFGAGGYYHHVIFKGEIDRIKDNNRYGIFEALPGSNLSFENGETQTADQFILSGKSSSPISLKSRVQGEEAFIRQSEGEVNGNYLVIEDNHAIGGAQFNAFNSIDQGNAVGWNIEETAPENYYWVGGSGDWSDLNHWSRSSGGNDRHIELPSAIDHVFFDEQSVTDSGAMILLDLETVLIDNLDLSGLHSGTELKSSNGKLTIYGDATLEKDLRLSFQEVEFAGDSIQHLRSNGSDWGPVSQLHFNAEGTIHLLDSLTAEDIIIESGEFFSNGHNIRTYGDLRLSNLRSPEIVLDQSKITTRRWFPSGSGLNLSLDQTSIFCFSTFYGEDFTYDELTFFGRIWVYGPVNAKSLSFLPNSEILILPGDTVKFETLNAVGSVSDSITIASREDGKQAYLYSEQGEVKGEYLIIKDNHAIGGATFIANNSRIEEANVIGWNDLALSTNDFNGLDFKIYPNTANDYFFIDEVLDVDEMLIYNMNGAHVATIPLGGANHPVRVNCSQFEEGFYVLRSRNGVYTAKLLISR